VFSPAARFAVAAARTRRQSETQLKQRLTERATADIG
jgi:hypothetical protein